MNEYNSILCISAQIFQRTPYKKKARGLAGGRAGLWAGVRAGIYDAQARVSGQASALDKAVAFWQ